MLFTKLKWFVSGDCSVDQALDLFKMDGAWNTKGGGITVPLTSCLTGSE